MRRTTLALAVAMAMALGVAGTALAKSDAGCTRSFTAIPIASDDAYDWWDLTVDGFAAEGLSPEEAAAMFGFDDVADFEAFVVAGVVGWDRNLNGMLCYKTFPPQQNGSPAYLFVAIDD